MSQLAVVTPSYGPDVRLFAELHRSVQEYTSEETVHHVIVPPADQALFAPFAGSRCRVWTESELLPRKFCRTPKPGWWVNLRRPWPPIRGWVLQQALKIAAAAMIEAEVVLIADSDVVLVRPTDAVRFVTDGRLSLYRLEDAVHNGMERHIKWHQVARRLLGLPSAPPPPLHDYVSSLNIWSPPTVRAMQRRVAEVAGRPWLDVITSELHLSEFILYGVFVDEILSAGRVRPAADTSFCHDYWDTTPLDTASALEFVDRLSPDAVGMMVSSKSNTPAAVRLAAARRCAEITGGPHADRLDET